MKQALRHLYNAMDYATYRSLIDALLLEHKTTGTNQSSTLTEYTRLNVARMKRVDKTIEILPALQDVVREIKMDQTWIVITEGWCGDAAQIVPLFNALSLLNDHIILRFVLRDENAELMNGYLTNGTRSIPKLIVTHSDNQEEIFNWGPRPKPLQEKFYQLRTANLTYLKIAEQLHSWYSKDKTMTTQQELALLFANS